MSDPAAIQTDCAPIGSDSCPLRLRLDCDSSRQVGAPTQDPCPGGPPQSSRCLAIFAILAQSCGLWIDCRFKAILTQFRRIATNCHCNRHPGLRQYLTKQKSDWNLRTAILTAIYTIVLNCGEIAKPQRIARGSPGLHQNHG